MLVDLVQVTASDGVRLHGALETPAATGGGTASTIDAWLCVHGTGSNFYAASTLGGLAPKLLATGAAVLRANTRGHDVICTGPSAGGHALLGAAFERVSESPLDLHAWIEFLQSRGYQRIGLLGHSLGAIKAILTLAGENPPPVQALVAASPPRLSYEHFRDSRQSTAFLENLATAEKFIDRYGPAENYNILRMLDRVQTPTLVTYGSLEIQQHEAFQGMPEAIEQKATEANRLQVAVVAGADHQYTACHDTLAMMIAKWLRKL